MHEHTQAKQMLHLNESILSIIIAELPNSFDSHQLIQAIMTIYPQEYVRQLYENVAAIDPIRTTHAKIERRIHLIPSVAAAPQRVESENVRGPETRNQQWQKLPITLPPNVSQQTGAP
ncbi:hypothetical protein [Novipirellula sp.]|uniref:hypothetical protein n=1 Tax=Novipirellula sp. TaxID=2795430 RepID=UPI00356473AA